MRIAVTSQLQLGSHRAHAINVVKTAGGFARLGHHVRLFCLQPEHGRSIESALSLYAEPSIQVVCCPPERLDPAKGADPDTARAAGEWMADAVANWRPDACFSRDFWSPLLIAKRNIPVIIETHAYVGDTNPLLARVLASSTQPEGVRAISTISPVLAESYATLGADAKRIHVIPDGVDTDLFSRPTDWSPARSDRPVVTYAGHLYDYKGIPTILQAAHELPDLGIHLVGGTDKDRSRVQDQIDRERITNVRVVGHVPHAEVPPHLWNADALLLPPSAQEPSKDWTSPVKLGEYLAAGQPIIASAIPALKHWIDDRVCTWFEPDNPRDLAQAIRDAIGESPARAESRREIAAELASNFSYAERAGSMLRALILSASRVAA